MNLSIITIILLLFVNSTHMYSHDFLPNYAKVEILANSSTKQSKFIKTLIKNLMEYLKYKYNSFNILQLIVIVLFKHIHQVVRNCTIYLT